MDVFPCPSLGEMGRSVSILSGSCWAILNHPIAVVSPITLFFLYSDLADAQRALPFDTHEPHDYVSLCPQVFGVAQSRVFLPGVYDRAVHGAGVAPMMADAYCWNRVIPFL